jgi:hypothetical protein
LKSTLVTEVDPIDPASSIAKPAYHAVHQVVYQVVVPQQARKGIM